MIRGVAWCALALVGVMGLAACAEPVATASAPATAIAPATVTPAPRDADAGPRVLAEAPPIGALEAPRPRLPATVASADGRTVEVTDVGRIVALTGPIAEVVFSLGLGDHMVGRDVATTFPEAEHLPVVTNAHAVSAEGVLSLRPSLVLGDGFSGPPEALAAIRDAGVPVVIVPEAWTLDEMWPRMVAIAAALGVPEAGETLIARTRAELTATGSAADQDSAIAPVVAFLYLRGPAGVYLLGGDGSGADALVEAVGAIDAGSRAGLGPFTPLTSEALVKAAPDVLLLMTRGLESVGGLDGLLALPGVAQTPAGKARRVVAVEDGLLLNFGPRTPAVLAFLADAIGEAAGDTTGTRAGDTTP